MQTSNVFFVFLL